MPPIPIPNAACPLCGEKVTLYFKDHWRRYFQCSQCTLVHVEPIQWPDAQAERAHYDLHDNRVDDPGYRAFLARLATPLLQRLTPGSEGLDFGCGPGPTLATMLREADHRVALHDVFFHPNPSAFERQYDFITATEVLEHLHRPRETLERMWRCLKPGGWLGIMTRRLPKQAHFDRWHYRRDPTHVMFFAAATFRWLAERWGAEIELIGEDVVIFRSENLPSLDKASCKVENNISYNAMP